MPQLDGLRGVAILLGALPAVLLRWSPFAHSLGRRRVLPGAPLLRLGHRAAYAPGRVAAWAPQARETPAAPRG